MIIDLKNYTENQFRNAIAFVVKLEACHKDGFVIGDLILKYASPEYILEHADWMCDGNIRDDYSWHNTIHQGLHSENPIDKKAGIDLFSKYYEHWHIDSSFFKEPIKDTRFGAPFDG